MGGEVQRADGLSVQNDVIAVDVAPYEIEKTFNAETAEAAEKKCPRISQRALRALRSNVAFFTGAYGVGLS